MGTCCDWQSSVLPALHHAPSVPALPPDALLQLAADWRAGFFKEVKMRTDAGQAIEDIDVTHRRVLNWLLLAKGVRPAQWDDSVRNRLVQAWHVQQGTLGDGNLNRLRRVANDWISQRLAGCHRGSDEVGAELSHVGKDT